MVHLDKFYTRPNVARECLDIVGRLYRWDDWHTVVEPSAGSGSFYSQIPQSCKRVGLDLSPDHDQILEMDFFDFEFEGSGKVLVVGNPPFGRVSSTAVRFFNHAAQFADVIAFIIPRTFRRISVQNRLDMRFRLVHDNDIPITPCAFVPKMSVKCCFQIWERSIGSPRETVMLPTTCPDWDFLPHGPCDDSGQPTPPSCPDFAVRAYGGSCGEIRREGLDGLRPKSWHWIRVKGGGPDRVDEIIRRLRTLDYSVSLDTARQNSIGRAELVKLYTDEFVKNE